MKMKIRTVLPNHLNKKINTSLIVFSQNSTQVGYATLLVFCLEKFGIKMASNNMNFSIKCCVINVNIILETMLFSAL